MHHNFRVKQICDDPHAPTLSHKAKNVSLRAEFSTVLKVLSLSYLNSRLPFEAVSIKLLPSFWKLDRTWCLVQSHFLPFKSPHWLALMIQKQEDNWITHFTAKSHLSGFIGVHVQQQRTNSVYLLSGPFLTE